jgi:hypothetical protein
MINTLVRHNTLTLHKHMNTNKNAYEIRLNILTIAHGDLMTVFHEKLHNAKKRMVGDQDDSWVEDKIDDKVISDLLPTSEDIIKRAKELYAFVENA